MHRRSFIQRFRSKNASSPSPTPAMVHPRTRRLLGAPIEFVAAVCRSTEGRTALVVALYIYRRVIICKNQTVTLPSGELAELGLARRDKHRALARLQQAGLVDLVRAKGRTTQITLIWSVSPGGH